MNFAFPRESHSCDVRHVIRTIRSRAIENCISVEGYKTPFSYLDHIPVREVKPRSVTRHEVVITCATHSVPVGMRGGEFHARTIYLCSSATLSNQVNGEVVSEAWGHRRVTEPNLAFECHVKLGVQTHGRKFDRVSILLGCAKMENLKIRAERFFFIQGF